MNNKRNSAALVMFSLFSCSQVLAQSSSSVVNRPVQGIKFQTTRIDAKGSDCVPLRLGTVSADGAYTVSGIARTIYLGGVNLSFYSNSSCQASLNSISLMAADAYKNFYVKVPNKVGNHEVQSSTSAGSAKMLVRVTALASSPVSSKPTQLNFLNTSYSVAPNTCSNAYNIQFQNVSGVPAPVSATTKVYVIGNSVSIYSDAACAQSLSTVNFLAGEKTKTFYLKAINTGVNSLSLNSELGLTNSQTLTVTSSSTVVTPPTPPSVNIAPTKLVFLNAAQSLSSRACSSVYQIQFQNAAGTAGAVTSATKVYVTGNSVTIYSDVACTQQLSTVDFSSGDKTKSFYVKAVNTGSNTISLNSTLGFTSSQPIVVIPITLEFSGS